MQFAGAGKYAVINGKKGIEIVLALERAFDEKDCLGVDPIPEDLKIKFLDPDDLREEIKKQVEAKISSQLGGVSPPNSSY